MELDTLLARTVRGLEWIAQDEIASAGFVTERDWLERTLFVALGQHSPAAALQWQTVDDVFLLLMRGRAPSRHRTDLQSASKEWTEFDWSSAFSAAAERLEQAPVRQFTVSASFQGKRNYTRFELEDTLGAAIQQSSSLQYIPHREDAGASAAPALRLHLSGQSSYAGLRLGAAPLHRRPWKVCTAAGTLHPPVAAALSQFLARDRPLRVADPFCGCGTILVELARRPGRDDRRYGFDLHEEAVQCAAANAAAARVGITFGVADAGHLPLAERSIDALITNPPWEKQVETGGPAELMDRFVREADRLVAAGGCLIVLHAWESALREAILPRRFEVLHEQNIRTAGRIARLTVAVRNGGGGPLALERSRLAEAQTRMGERLEP